MLGEKLYTLRKSHGYSQQNLADMLSVTRQTISNWEANQGAPALDKALELAKVYKLSLNDLVEDNIEIIGSTNPSDKGRLLKKIIGKEVKLDILDIDLARDLNGLVDGLVTVLDVNESWMRISYERSKENTFFKKESIIKIIHLSHINGIKMEEAI